MDETKELTETQNQMLDLAQGNPGALSVLLNLQALPELIDFLHEFAPRGPDIWILYKDWCGENIETFVRIVGVLMAARRPELFQQLQAEREARLFTEAWEEAETDDRD